MSSDIQFWRRFFENAGLPPKIASKYSSLFDEHRIQRSMLPDLTKNILNEVGITAVGDVLAILKQAKIVANKDEVEANPRNQVAIMTREKRPATKEKGQLLTKSNVAVSSRTATHSTVSPMKRIRLQSPPDHDVVYRVKMPEGTTERSRQILKKAAAIKRKALVSKSKSVFDRLGASVGSSQRSADDDDDDDDDEGERLTALRLRLRKSVSFASGTKESSPEVTSTTDEYYGKMESDKMLRKVSALQRLGTKSTNDLVKLVPGERRLLIAKRTTTSKTSIFDRLGTRIGP